MTKGIPVLHYGDHDSLPLYIAMYRTLEDGKVLTKIKSEFMYVDPDYKPPQYRVDSETLKRLNTDPKFAITVVDSLNSHLSKYLYYVQFKDDSSGKLIRCLHDHIELVSALCDARFTIDPTELWQTFDGVFGFQSIHSDYRAEESKVGQIWEKYANRLREYYEEEFSKHLMNSRHLFSRIIKQIQLKSDSWSQLTPFILQGKTKVVPSEVSVFYSYSHKDEELRVQLQNHLSILRRKKIISEWNDRCISAGREWEGQIDSNLRSAQVILLLISADFLASDYCYDIETKFALDRHESGDARVIPIILRACDWKYAPFGKLQALPKDAVPVTSWNNLDEAFNDIAAKLGAVIRNMRIGVED